jgi:hypothetical protein
MTPLLSADDGTSANAEMSQERKTVRTARVGGCLPVRGSVQRTGQVEAKAYPSTLMGMTMTNSADIQSRVIMRIELLPQAKEHLSELSNRLGMTQVAMTSRLVEWVCQQEDVVQAAILGLYPVDIKSELPSLIFKRLAARKSGIARAQATQLGSSATMECATGSAGSVDGANSSRGRPRSTIPQVPS